MAPKSVPKNHQNRNTPAASQLTRRSSLKSSKKKRTPNKPKPSKKPEDLLPEEPPQEFLNRETQWLEFNHRVLSEALDPRTPLLERVRFHGIFTSNMDEFFMKRVGGLRRQVELNVLRRSGGMTPLMIWRAVRLASIVVNGS